MTEQEILMLRTLLREEITPVREAVDALRGEMESRLSAMEAQLSAQFDQQLHDAVEAIDARMDVKLGSMLSEATREASFLVEQREGRRIQALAEQVASLADRLVALEQATAGC